MEQLTTNDRSAQTVHLQMEMLTRGWTAKDLAERIGCSVGLMRQALSKSFRGYESRKWQVEAALGYAVPLWSDWALLKRRKHALGVIGFDPYLLGKNELIRRARAAGIEVRKATGLEAAREAVLDLCANRRAITQPQKATN